MSQPRVVLEIRTVRAIARWGSGERELIPSACPPSAAEGGPFSRFGAEMAYWTGFLFADGGVRPSCNVLLDVRMVGDIDQLRKLTPFSVVQIGRSTCGRARRGGRRTSMPF